MKLYSKFFAMHLKGSMQYKISFFLTTMGQFLVSFNVFLGIFFMYERFHEVKGFRLSEILLCYATVLMSYSLAEMFMRGFDTFAGTIGNGEFDRILLRPRNPILLVVLGKIEFTRIGRMLLSVFMFIYGIQASEVEWNLYRIATICLMVIGGTVVFGCLFVIYAGICFFTLEGLEFMNVLTDGAKEFGQYPLVIYGKGVLRFCTYLVPYALFQYYPFLYLTGRSEQPLYMLLPIIACLFILPSYLFWKAGVKHYQSTGS